MNRELSQLLQRALARDTPRAQAPRQVVPRPSTWEEYLAKGPVASPGFMDNVEDLPARERKR